MALSSLSFLAPHPPPDLLPPLVTSGASTASSRLCSLSASSPFLWISSERSQSVVVAAKGKREKMDFEFLDDDDGMKEENTIPDYFVDMEEWMRNRPSGFGVGKVYDLTLEEKLLAEIEGDKKAREAAKRNKESQGKMTPKKPKVTEPPAGVEVWVGNLPRKRKVDRDLRAAFRNAPGLLHIRPIVEPENEKTRDPMCRGFGFFTFATEDDAYDFVSVYNGEQVKFGKVEKQIACEVAKSDSPWHPKAEHRASSAISVPNLQVRDTDSAEEPRLPSTPTKKMDRELDIVTATSFTKKSFEEEEEEEDHDDDDDDVSETKLRAMEEEIWDQFEDDDDLALDLELAQKGDLDDEDESSQIRSAVDEDEFSEPEESVRGTDTNVEETGGSRVSGRKARESLHEEDEDVDEEEYSVEKIKVLEAKVREMEKKLQLTVQNEAERIALLEKRLLSKGKSAVGASVRKGAGEKKKAGAKKKSQAGKKPEKPKKIGSLGSASRLKAKERAILTGVLSKYVSSSP